MKRKYFILRVFLSILLFGLGLELGSSFSSFWYRYKNRIPLKKEGSFRILFLGELYTKDKESSYIFQFKKLLEQKKSNLKFEIIDMCQPNMDLNSVVRQLDDNLKLFRPNLLIVGIGWQDSLELSFFNAKEIPLREIFHLYLKRLRLYQIFKKIFMPPKKIPKVISKGMEDSLIIQEKIYQQRIEINPSDYNNYIELARVYFIRKDYLKAEDNFNKAIELTDDPFLKYRLYIQLGLCFLYQEKYDEAEKNYLKAISLNPENSLAYSKLGYLYILKKEYSKAEEIFKKLIKNNPLSADLYIDLAYCYSLKGDYSKADINFKRAIELEPNNLDAYQGLAELYLKQADDKSLKEVLKKIEDLISPSTELETLLNKIKDNADLYKIKLALIVHPLKEFNSIEKFFLSNQENILIVDNSKVFKKKIEFSGYKTFFYTINYLTYQGANLVAKNLIYYLFRNIFK